MPGCPPPQVDAPGSCCVMTGEVSTVIPVNPAAANMDVAAAGDAIAVDKLAAAVLAAAALATGKVASISTLAGTMVRLLPAGGLAPKPAADDRADRMLSLRGPSKSPTSPLAVNATRTLSACDGGEGGGGIMPPLPASPLPASPSSTLPESPPLPSSPPPLLSSPPLPESLPG